MLAEALPYRQGMAANSKRSSGLTAEERNAAARLKEIWNARKKTLGLSQAAVAERFGMTQGGLGHYLNGRNALNARVCIQFAALLGIREEDFAPPAVLKELEQMRKGAASLAEQFVPVPHYAARMAAGAGANDDNALLESLMFRRDWLAKEGLTAEHLCVVSVTGDSMAPQLADGDQVLVRQDRRTIENGKVYALNHGGDQRVKRVFRPRPNFLLLQSDNEGNDTGPELLRTGDLDEVTVIGEVWMRIGRVR